MARLSSILFFPIFTVQFAFGSALECKLYYSPRDLKAVTQALSLPSDSTKPSTLKAIQGFLGLDDLNFTYLQVLMGGYARGKESKGNESTILIADRANLRDAEGRPNMVIPTAVATQSQMKAISVTQYSDVLKRREEYTKAAVDVSFWVKKLMAGTGSGIVRKRFLKDVYTKLGRSESIKIGSKGTDLHTEIIIDGKSYLLSIAELQIMQLLAKSDQYNRVIFHDVVSTETQGSIEATWTKASSVMEGSSLAAIARAKGEIRNQPTVQSHLPTIDKATGELTFERMAPGGHGLFAIEAILATLQNRNPKSERGKTLVGVIGNGEDLMSTPSPEIVGWVAKEKIPVVMVTTEKTSLDKQGGQVSIGYNSKGMAYATMVEKAQAEAATANGNPGQIDLFYKLGLREGDSKAMFNTNMVLVNYEALAPKLHQLAAKVGGNEKLLALVAPDLIANTKEQQSGDVVKLFTQLEGAMGSVFLKLDRLYRENFDGKALVHFLNIEKEHRTQFFAPIKTAFDFFMQFYSDRFFVDGRSFSIKDQRPGSVPKVTLLDGYYNEAANVLEAFRGTSILRLDELTIDGITTEVNGKKVVNGVVFLPTMKLEGKVHITNLTGQPINLPVLFQKNDIANSVLKDVAVTINADGTLSILNIEK